MLSWVRAIHATCGHMYSAEYMHFAESVEPKRDEHWVETMVRRSVKPLFFEAMKRWIHEGGDPNKLRLLIVGMAEYESQSDDQMRFLSDEVQNILRLDPHRMRHEALLIDPPEMTHMARIPWLASELHSVCELNQDRTRRAVKRKHWQVYEGIYPCGRGCS